VENLPKEIELIHMDSQEIIIRRTVGFIFEKYVSKLQTNIKETMRTTSLMSDQYIIQAVTSSQIYFIADEILFFYLAINEQLINFSTQLLVEEVDSFPMFPFPVVLPLSSTVDQLEMWKNIEPYIDLFMAEHCFFRTPRLEIKSSEAPIYCCRQDIDDYESSGILCYSSLTNLLLMVAECYETGAYYFHRPSSYGYWKEDFSKSEPIFRKYHTGLKFRSPHEPTHFLT
jgi:hypothetical protein